MALNPDRDENRQPSQGDLRFVEREVDNHGTPKLARILQRWEYSFEGDGWGWYDVPLEQEFY